MSDYGNFMPPSVPGMPGQSQFAQPQMPGAVSPNGADSGLPGMGQDMRQRLAMAMMPGMMNQQGQNNSAPAGAAMNGIANGMNMMTMMKMMGR